ncbi:MAG: hypothetical protein ACLRXC_10755 [[Clostridium] leptum]
MQEVLTRRSEYQITRAKRGLDVTDLILLDGGRGRSARCSQCWRPMGRIPLSVW